MALLLTIAPPLIFSKPVAPPSAEPPTSNCPLVYVPPLIVNEPVPPKDPTTVLSLTLAAPPTIEKFPVPPKKAPMWFWPLIESEPVPERLKVPVPPSRPTNIQPPPVVWATPAESVYTPVLPPPAPTCMSRLEATLELGLL